MNIALDMHDSCPHCGSPILNLQTGPKWTCNCTQSSQAPNVNKVNANSGNALDIIEDLLQQCCSVQDDKGGTYLDSGVVRAYSKAIDFLSANGRVKIKGRAGRRVLAEFI